MEEAERYVRTWVASPRDKEIEDTISGMSQQPIQSYSLS
jgi:DNA repair/transcription protein MET18/MMS19